MNQVGGYYYLMAQLPGLHPDAPAAITYERFREIALRFLTPDDAKVLSGLSLEPPRVRLLTGSAVVDGWYDFERSLRLSLERLRAQKLARTIALSGDDEANIYLALETLPIARSALSLDDPLEAERYLIRARAEFVDRTGALHYYDADAVLSYGLMLLLHERGERFAAEAGRASYTTIYHQILGE